MPISKDESRRIWEEVKANHAKLDACASHDFQPVPGRHKHIPDYVCSRCGGKIDSIAHSWYQRGVRDGRKSLHSANGKPVVNPGATPTDEQIVQFWHEYIAFQSLWGFQPFATIDETVEASWRGTVPPRLIGIEISWSGDLPPESPVVSKTP